MDAEKLYARALDIQEGKAAGFWVPMMRRLALRGHDEAMIDLANWYSYSNSLSDLGEIADFGSAANLYYRAYRMGNARAAQHLAMGCFNRNDLKGYRYWLNKAARAGDRSAGRELKYFETRLPHNAARDIGRHRPSQRRDWEA